MSAVFSLPERYPDTWRTMMEPWVDGIPPITQEDERRMRIMANLMIDRILEDRSKRLAIKAKSINDVG